MSCTRPLPVQRHQCRNLVNSRKMLQPSSTSANHPIEQGSLPGGPATLERRIGLRSAVLFNMLEMIGVGPFITLPLVIAAAGYRLAVWAWVLGAVIAIADGLVWAELGAAFPRAGGSYAFLREIYGPEGPGNWLSFLYVWQVSFTAPLSVASGCIGLSGFLAVFWPSLDSAPIAALPALHYANFAAAAACLLVTALLYRNLSSITRLAWVLFAGVIAALAGVIVSGFAHAAATGGWHMPAAPALSLTASLGGLAQATLLAIYCYWGYYNICFLGGRGPPSRAHHPPRHHALSALRLRALYRHEPGRAAFAAWRRNPRRRIRRPARAVRRRHRPLRLRPLGRLHHRRPHRLDRLCQRLLAPPRLLPRPLRRRPRWQLLPLSRRRASQSTEFPTARS